MHDIRAKKRPTPQSFPAEDKVDTLTTPRVQVIIVNYRTPHLTIDCLRSLEEERLRVPGLQVTVVDGDSGDESVPRIAEALEMHDWHAWVKLMPLVRNGGFAFANNAALRGVLAEEVRPHYVLLLNPDTVVRPRGIAALVRYLEQHPEMGIVGSRLEDPDGTPQHSAFRFHTLLSELDGGMRWGWLTRLMHRHTCAPPVSENACLTDWVSGASMLVRREVFESIGLLDEGYFMYYEETDFCLRAARAGWACGYEPRSRVIHLVGQASGIANGQTRRKRLPTYWFDSRRRYFIKNYGRLYAMLVDAVWMASYCVWLCRARLQRKPPCDPPRLLRDFLRNSVFCRGFET